MSENERHIGMRLEDNRGIEGNLNMLERILHIHMIFLKYYYLLNATIYETPR